MMAARCCFSKTKINNIYLMVWRQLKFPLMRKTLMAVIVLLLMATLACGRSGAVAPIASTSPVPATPAPVSTPPTSLPAGESTHTLNQDGRLRSYILYIPASINWSKPVPLVFVLHGGTGNAESAVRLTGFNQVADQNGFIIAYPNGTSWLSDTVLLTWNGGNCCGYAQTNNVDDVGFMRAIVKELQVQAQIDPKRIYATGMSNGGILAQRLGCEAADLFAAIAPVAGTLNFSCEPSQPIAVIEFHGTADQHVPYRGGYGPQSLAQVNFASVNRSIEFWVITNQCKSQPQTSTFADIQHYVWAGCKGSSAVELYAIIGGGHAWPGGGGLFGFDQPSRTIAASQLIWEFFAQHPKP
jgi:polyhydroxybutyrate depolymerase